MSPRTAKPAKTFSPWQRLLMIVGVPVLVTLLLDLPALQSTFVPSHDTFHALSGFALYAKHLRQFGEIPLWMPGSTFGVPLDWRQLVLLSPANWLFILLAFVFRGADLLWLFKLSVVLEQILFGMSCAWLAGMLFRRKSIQVFFVVAAMMAAGPWKQIFFDLRILTPIPWILGLVLLGWRRKSRPLLLASLLPIPVTAYGAPYYYLAYLSILWTVAMGVCLLGRRKAGLAWLKAPLVRGQLWREGIPLILLIAFSISVAGQLLLVKHGQTPVSPGRDPVTGISPPSVYLAWGGTTDLPMLIQSTAYAFPDFAHNREAFTYCGVPVIFAAFLGLILARSRSARLGRWLLLFTAAFSVAGVLTLLLYKAPLMSNFRHVAYTGVVVRFFICVVAGFGAQALLDVVGRRRLIQFKHIVWIPFAVALFFFVFMPIPPILSRTAGQTGKIDIAPEANFIRFSLGAGLVSGLGIWIAGRALQRSAAVRMIGFILLISLIDTAWVFSHKIFERETWRLPPEQVEFARKAIANPLGYVPIRGQTEADADKFLGDLLKQGARYDTTDSLMGRDAPLTGERRDVISTSTVRLVQMQSSTPEIYRFFTMPGQPKAFLADHAEVSFGSMQLDPGNVLLETGNASFTLKYVPAATVEAKDFSFNEVRFVISSKEQKSDPTNRRFLVYQDASHPEWSAFIHGQPVAVQSANVAFKAVELPPDASEVTFRFGNGMRRRLAWMNALAALAVLGLEAVALLFLSGAAPAAPESSGQPASKPADAPAKTSRKKNPPGKV